VAAKKEAFVSDVNNESSDMHATYTMPDEPGSFGGARRSFFGMRFNRRDAQRYLRTQEAYMLHRQARRRSPHCKMLSNGIADLYRADLVDLSGIANYNNLYCYL